MNKDKILLILFCIMLPLLLLLISYKIVVGTADYTQDQQKWMDFLNGYEKPENYTNNEASHMQDVKETMTIVDYVFYFLLIGVSLILRYYKNSKSMTKKISRFGGTATVVSIIFILFLSFFSFNYLFTLFHNVFFPQGNWMFPLDSKLISTFPLDFFISISGKIFFLTLFFGIIFILVGRYLQK